VNPKLHEVLLRVRRLLSWNLSRCVPEKAKNYYIVSEPHYSFRITPSIIRCVQTWQSQYMPEWRGEYFATDKYRFSWFQTFAVIWILYTRVGTLILATIYLQLIQN